MIHDAYPLATDPTATFFAFESIGKKGIIVKAVQIEWVNAENHYNLGFGDFDYNTGQINDKVASGNGDMDKVLSTVVSALMIFWNHYPEATVFAVGSDAKRTRLYQMGIARHLSAITEKAEIWGGVDGVFEPFAVGRNYNSFLAKRRKH